MKKTCRFVWFLALLSLCLGLPRVQAATDSQLLRLPYNQPNLAVDLGVGLWGQPFPMDFDGDGDNDLLVASADVPFNGIYFFENAEGDAKFPVFRPGKRLDKGIQNTTCSYVNGQWIMQTPETCYPDFKNTLFSQPQPIAYKQEFFSGRDNQWKLADFDGDGLTDLLIGASDWRDYGWDNAFNEKGEWTHGPIHGYVYVVKNMGSNEQPKYSSAVQLEAEGKPIEVFGCPSPNLADWDGDGDQDLICGEFLDKLTYFENIGTRTAPQFRGGRHLTYQGAPIRMELEMLQVCAFDWDKDGDMDLVVGQEDGRVALVENTGTPANGMPQFLPPHFFQQQAEYLKSGVLATPYGVDWDSDGDEDLLAGDSAGFINFIENLDGGNPPQWAAPVHLSAGGETVRIQAGDNGSIQGPAEAKWGYTVFCVADWDHDGLNDIVLNSIWGEVVWYRNVGTTVKPQLEKARPIEVSWEGAPPKPAWLWWNPKGKQLVTQWRTRPMVIDWNKDGLNDLVMLDYEGYLAFFARRKNGDALELLPGQRILLDEDGNPLRLNAKESGKSGRRKFIFADWDRDGKRDILLDGKNIDFLKNVGETEFPGRFKNMGRVDSRVLAGHDTCPATVDWDKNGVPDLVIGAEDGCFYYLKNPN